MSIKVSSLIWDKWPNGGSEMLCVLALSDWCNDEGGSLYPSINTLARKMRVSDRQAQRILHGLIDQGFVSVIGNKHGGAPGSTRQYHLNVPKIAQLPDYGSKEVTGDAGVTPDIETGDTSDVDGCHGRRETGDTDVTQDVIEPLEDPLVNQGELKEKRQKRKTSLPEGFKPNETCRSKAIQLAINMELELEKFQDFHQAKGNKYVDWQAAFRNWLTKAAEFRAKRGGNVADIYEHRQRADVEVKRGPVRGRPIPYGSTQPDDDGILTLPDGTQCHVDEWDAGNVKWEGQA